MALKVSMSLALSALTRASAGSGPMEAAVDQLAAEGTTVKAGGIWVQDAGGVFRLLVVNGPAFLRDQFRAAFPSGLPSNFAVTLVR